jgi:lambda repressor-like predicted transcriptional regulator
MTRREEIKARLRSEGSNMSSIANDLGLAPSTVQSVVSGRSYSKTVAEAIAQKLSLKISDIWPERATKEDHQ